MKRLSIILLTLVILTVNVQAASPLEYSDNEEVLLTDYSNEMVTALADINITAPSAILIEKETGTVIFEKNPDEKMEPASVTKIMTILLIVEALEDGRITLDEMVTASAYACSMGGSQIFLKEGEQMSVHDMLKSIVVASANDAAVAMAEHLYGTEEVFVSKMNERAMALGMTNTTFFNCTGLLDQPEHLTTARDIAIMSRELIAHDIVKEYTTIWMDTVRGGEFGLSNTNKLIYYYDGATGLKTGFTSRSMYCLSATAERDGVEYIAVILHAETSKDRFEDAKTLLSYAFANYALISTTPDEALPPVRIKLGKHAVIQPSVLGTGKLLIEKSKLASISKTVDIVEEITAPVTAGDQLGTLTIRAGEELLGTYTIASEENVERLSVLDIFFSFFSLMFKGK